MDKEKIKIASAKEYKKQQKGNVKLQNGLYFAVEQIPLDVHMEVFEEISKEFPDIAKHALMFHVGRDSNVRAAYAKLALPIFVKKPNVTPEEESNSVGVDTMSLLDVQTLVTASLVGVNTPDELMAAFRGREPDIDKIMDELSSI